MAALGDCVCGWVVRGALGRLCMWVGGEGALGGEGGIGWWGEDGWLIMYVCPEGRRRVVSSISSFHGLYHCLFHARRTRRVGMWCALGVAGMRAAAAVCARARERARRFDLLDPPT